MGGNSIFVKRVAKRDSKMRFRKKPIVIEAEQWTGEVQVKGMCNSLSCLVKTSSQHVHTIHNNQIVILELGDWIIPEPDGEHFYPCKPDIFEATYERVDDNETGS